MKKIISLFILGLCMLVSSCAMAQTTTPRFGTTPNQDNTGRVLTYGTGTVTASTATVNVPIQTTYYKMVTLASTSLSPTFSANVTKSYQADQMDLIVTNNATGTRTITLGTNFRANTATTQTLAASKQAAFRFVFDGSKWVEVARSIEP